MFQSRASVLKSEWVTMEAKAKVSEELPPGCGWNWRCFRQIKISAVHQTLTSRALSRVSKTRPGSGSMLAGMGCLLCTLRAYGRADWPRSGTMTLLQLPSGCLYR